MEATQTRKRQRFVMRDYVVMGENVIVTAYDYPHGRTWTAFTHLPTGDMRIMDYGGEIFATQDDKLSSRGDDFWVWAAAVSVRPAT